MRQPFLFAIESFMYCPSHTSIPNDERSCLCYNTAMKTEDIPDFLSDMKAAYWDASCALDFETPYELLVATVLSAQCTDERVNKVTSVLFRRASTPEQMLGLTIDELEDIIRPCGLYKTKAAHIMSLSRTLVEDYGSRVPETRAELKKLPGVGEKTASVVLSNAFGVPAIAVDTHVFRVSGRLGLSHEKTPDKTAQVLMKTFPEEDWSLIHHMLIKHGREICRARNPECSACPVRKYCEYYEKTEESRPALT